MNQCKGSLAERCWSGTVSSEKQKACSKKQIMCATQGMILWPLDNKSKIVTVKAYFYFIIHHLLQMFYAEL